MGAFVAVYNYLGFHLVAEPFALPAWLVTLLFLAYLAGTVSSPWAGALAVRFGRFPVPLGSTGVMATGAALMLAPVAVLAGLLLFTAGFFGAHAIASGWTPADATAESRAQASSLYYFAYHAGSSLFGWGLGLGLVFGQAGWTWFLVAVLGMCAVAAAAALGALRGVATGRI